MKQEDIISVEVLFAMIVERYPDTGPLITYIQSKIVCPNYEQHSTCETRVSIEEKLAQHVGVIEAVIAMKAASLLLKEEEEQKEVTHVGEAKVIIQ